MALFHIALVLLVSVLVSAVLEQFVPRVSLPLVQVVIGLAISLPLGSVALVQVDPELFLVLFIAPLLFDESRHVPLASMARHWRPIASLSLGLVVATALAVSVALHAVLPTVPLAAAIALGGAVAPTDAAAVYALSRDVAVTKRQDAILSAESLFNDASGVVTFQFAVAAAVTGSFSAAEVSVAFAVTFAGGLAVGALMGLAGALVLRALGSTGLESTTAHVAFEVLTPFLVYLVAGELGVSGILAVVAAGIVMAAMPERRTPARARMRLVSSNVWEFVTFIINGVVFVILGMELPRALLPSWRSPAISNGTLLASAVAVCLVVVAVRLGWTLAMELVRARSLSRSGAACTGAAERGAATAGGALRSAALLTLAGPKGAITLSVILTLPYLTAAGDPFPERNVLVFIASFVIVATLLLANFAMPLVAPSPEDADGEARALDEARLAVLEPVVRELSRRPRDTAAARAARRFVLSGYGDRIARARNRTVDPHALVCLRLETLDRQRATVATLAGDPALSPAAVERYDAQLSELFSMVARLGRGDPSATRVRRRRPSALRALARSLADEVRGRGSDGAFERTLPVLARASQEAAIGYLSEVARDPSPERSLAARLLLSDHWAVYNALVEGPGTGASPVPPGPRPRRDLEHLAAEQGASLAEARHLARTMTAEGLRLELDRIDGLVASGDLSHGQAAELTEEVHVLQLGL